MHFKRSGGRTDIPYEPISSGTSVNHLQTMKWPILAGYHRNNSNLYIVFRMIRSVEARQVALVAAVEADTTVVEVKLGVVAASAGWRFWRWWFRRWRRQQPGLVSKVLYRRYFVYIEFVNGMASGNYQPTR